MTEPSYVYVVTHSAQGCNEGEFFREEAFISEDDAFAVADECMDAHGGRDTYEAVDRRTRGAHIVGSWDGGLKPGVPKYFGMTVWVERLFLHAVTS